jgi:hypothetical protein
MAVPLVTTALIDVRSWYHAVGLIERGGGYAASS